MAFLHVPSIVHGRADSADLRAILIVLLDKRNVATHETELHVIQVTATHVWKGAHVRAKSPFEGLGIEYEVAILRPHKFVFVGNNSQDDSRNCIIQHRNVVPRLVAVWMLTVAERWQGCARRVGCYAGMGCMLPLYMSCIDRLKG